MKSFLTENQVLTLKLAHRQQRDKRLADKIKALVSLNAGYPVSQIIAILLIDEITLYRWKKRFLELGIEGLLECHYCGGKSRLTSVQEQEIKQYFQIHTAPAISAAAARINNKYNISCSIIGAAKLMHRLGFSCKKPKIVPGKANIEKQAEFVKEYQKVKSELGPNDQVYFVDSTHPSHNTQLSYGWILKGKKNDKFVKTNTGRDRLNLNGALSFNSKTAIVLEEKTVNSESTIRLLETIKNKQKTGKVYLILDNASHHHAKVVGRWILHHPRFKRIFLPPSSPNLNPIERLWLFFHKQVTNNHYFEIFEEFKDTILKFFNNLKTHETELSTLLTDNFRLAPEANFQT